MAGIGRYTPGGGDIGNLRVPGMATWFLTVLVVGMANDEISGRHSDFPVGMGALCLCFP
jgi:hypothetical protein